VKAVNLIPASQRQPTGGLANRSGGVAYVLLGGVACVGGLAALYGLAEREVANKEAEAARLEAQARSLQAKASGLAAYKSFIALRQQRETEILSLINSRFNWAHLLAELSADLPAGATVTNLSGTIGGPNATTAGTAAPKGGAPTSATPAGSVPTLALSGCAPSGGGLPKVLSRLRLIEGVKTVELKSGTKQQAGSGGSVAGGCGNGEYSFSISVAFNGLPSPPTTARAVVVPGAAQPTAAKPAQPAPRNVSLAAKGGKEVAR